MRGRLATSFVCLMLAEYTDFMYKPEPGPWKKLSTHERLARAMLHWFEFTGDAAYLDQARKMLDYVETHLCTEDCYQPGVFILLRKRAEGRA